MKLWDDFIEGFKEEAGKPLPSETKPKDLLEGFSAGVIETAVHPFRWFRTLRKK
ncbi:hypothetical protein HZF05_16450 [Sphingomonas sp. CGMCC 1.13654]|uniref:Uncharacterized protein n=1 Tax=Sphingomonas chungangi TaxID=2683589 RepID=A0A838LAD9_9SPHN|nr:hypothetical protein [Sphingomonas chungangi]MBA2935675.1 hypothetical protein [Sphingomonas chungangi]MVW54365.1 hypothetical protein [Sphingomonas chungangi]